MAYDEPEIRPIRLAVQTPSSDRQYVTERSGLAAALLATTFVATIAIVSLLLLFFTTRSSNDVNDANGAAQQQQPPQTTIVQPPAQQPPVFVQQPALAAQPAPVVNSLSSGSSGVVANVPDATIQAEIARRISNDATLSGLGITANVLNDKVKLIGTVKTDHLRNRIENLACAVKRVTLVENQIAVISR